MSEMFEFHRGPTAPEQVDGTRHEDAVHPRAEPGLAAESGQDPPRLQNGLLHGVFGVLAVGQEFQREALQHGARVEYQGAEGLPVAALGGP